MTTTKETVQNVCAKIAPLWPLKNYVAVNPYLGFTGSSFQETAKIMSARSNIRMTMPLDFYLNKIEDGTIDKDQLEEALVENGQFKSSNDFLQEVKDIIEHPKANTRLKTMVDLVDDSDELNQTMIDSISSFAAAYFDENQAIWKGPKAGLLVTYLNEAQIDRTPQLAGLHDFRKIVGDLSQQPETIIDVVSTALEVAPDEAEAYYHTLLLKTVGWSSFIAGVDWNNNLYSSPTHVLEELLAILLIWEYASLKSIKSDNFLEEWKKQKSLFKSNDFAIQNEVLDMEIILQDAFDRSHQSELIHKLNANRTTENSTPQSAIQSVFCIDVRSEVIRRNIENVNANIETIGFAGFFGFPIKYQETTIDQSNNQCPVLIPAGPSVTTQFDSQYEKDRVEKSKININQFKKTWKNYKSGAVSAFSYVSPLGIFYLPKLIKDSFSLGKKRVKTEVITPTLDLSNIALVDQVNMAESTLTAMGIKDRLSELVVIVGHGSSSTNNPHASGLDCGACGGHSGKYNALTAAQVLNDPRVREELFQRGTSIPENTLFAAGLHDTTTDEIQIFTPHQITTRQAALIKEVKESFSKASNLARAERSVRFSGVQRKQSDELKNRANDWSQVRPEWGLAGCSSFIVGDRAISKDIDLQGRAFMHNYNWSSDTEFKILETIISAPMVVTSWINLQYYASVADNNHFGAGNKTLHNVTGGIGVIEGSGGDLKTGLALQSVHDGINFQHQPNRLNVFIQAPASAISDILTKHASIKDLFDNNWIYLFRIDDQGKVTHKYMSNNNWEELKSEQVAKKKAVSIEV